jgi:pyruvate kinase
MVDLSGREVKCSANPAGPFNVRSGDQAQLLISEFNEPTTANTLRINSETVIRALKPNDVVYIDDGNVVAIVQDVMPNGCKLGIKQGGEFRPGCQVRFVGGKHNHEQIITKEDLH